MIGIFDKNDNICYLYLTKVVDMVKILLGSRIPEPVVKELRGYCKSRGIVMSHFVSKAIEEKLRKVNREKKQKEKKQ